MYGVSHKWGDVWEYVDPILLYRRIANKALLSEIIEQVWANIKLNCGLQYTPIPANNRTGYPE